MKILITNTGPWGTGSFTVAHAVSKELLWMGHEVRFFFPDTGIPADELDYYYDRPDLFKIWSFPIKGGSITLESFPLMIPDPHPRSADNKTFRDLSNREFAFYLDEARKALGPVIREFDPDIVECQHIWTMDRIVDEMGYPYICTAHHSDQMGHRYDKRIQAITLKSAHNASFIFAVSEYVKRDVISLYGLEEDKVVVLTNGYDKEVFRPFKVDERSLLKELGLDIPPDVPLASFGGKISKTKGIDLLMMANKLLGPEFPVHFLVLGAGDPSMVMDADKMDQYSLDRMHFLGHRSAETLARIHNICDFSILPSRSEGFGIACLEAMGCGLPVIVTDAGGLKEFAVGEIVENENLTQLTDALRKFVSMSPRDHHLLSKKAYQTATSYSWRAITETRLRYYRETTKRHPSTRVPNRLPVPRKSTVG